MTLEELNDWDRELGINHDAPPVTDEQILEWLMEDEKRAVEDNPDCPPYDPKIGL